MPLDVLFTLDDIVEKLFELIVFEETPAEHAWLNDIDSFKENLEGNVLLNSDAWIFFSNLFTKFVDLLAEFFKVLSWDVA